MNTGGPASEKTLLDEFAGQALTGLLSSPNLLSALIDESETDETPKPIAIKAYEMAESMLDEKARREATGKDSLTVQTREVDDDYWAKFQDGIIITFEPTMGWCASIREGSLGSGNTIAEAVANLRTMWEERSAAPVVQESSTTPDAGNVAELQAANRELVEALSDLVELIEVDLLEQGFESSPSAQSSLEHSKAILSKHKGAA